MLIDVYAAFALRTRLIFSEGTYSILTIYSGGNNINIYEESYFYKKILGYESISLPLSLTNKLDAYNSFELSINNKVRNINAINSKSDLFAFQKNLLNNFLIYIPLPNCVCGFVKGKNYLDFLKEHLKKDFYLRLDIKDFFPSLKSENIKDVLDEYIIISDINEKTHVLDTIIDIVTLNGSLPQGAVTSPQVSNVVFRRLDIRIRNYCRKFNISYTRYADDMLFSSNDSRLHKDFFVKMISKILKDNCLELNRSKIKKTKEQIVLNGYVVSNRISLSRNKLKKVNTLIYAYENLDGKKKKPKNFNEYLNRITTLEDFFPSLPSNIEGRRNVIVNYLAGYRSYLLSFDKDTYRDICVTYPNKIKKIEFILKELM
ncbi:MULTISPECIES: reverse transcriptase family protein [unclassified Exiguobacterium]|uniref:reverse transcriptase family protein n=1 Tax=unclassified Exiguobacterium TaxID=2644629 RepID=UPI001BE92C89|nr:MULTISPECIES: reverse transcriptase family protein [unclassified Exiguobacterium]